MRHTRAHSANRRSHHKAEAAPTRACEHCGAQHRIHHLCGNCGHYRGRQVVDLKAKNEARDARIQAKRNAIRSELGQSAEPQAPAEETK